MPDPRVPTKFITPINANALAATVTVKPCSTACAIKWVPMRPLEVAPQIKNVVANSQKSRLTNALRITPGSLTRGVGLVSGVAPNATIPTSAGSVRTKASTGIITTAAVAATTTDAVRQPSDSVTKASNGINKSCPALVAAPNNPCTRPRWATNQRVATAAPSTPPTIPVPIPLRAPQVNAKPNSSVIRVPATALKPIAINPIIAVERVPTRSMSVPMNGPDNPYRSNPIETARLMELRVQPNSVVSAGKKTPGATRAPAEMRMAAATAAMTNQWREMRICLPSCYLEV